MIGAGVAERSIALEVAGLVAAESLSFGASANANDAKAAHATEVMPILFTADTKFMLSLPT
jgi:hypothetical protein